MEQTSASALRNYRTIARLLGEGTHLIDLLDYFGLEDIYIYGAGEMGWIIASDLRSSTRIKGVYDKSFRNEFRRWNEELGLQVCNPLDIPDDSIPILVTPMNGFWEIANSLVAQGIDSRRLISLNAVLRYGEELLRADRMQFPEKSNTKLKHFLISGVNFTNKGSQSMTFVMMDAIRKKFKNSVIWISPNKYDPVYYGENYNCIWLTDGNNEKSLVCDLMNVFTAVIDVSGYAVYSGSLGGIDRLCKLIKMADFFRTPFIMMPQSFGPFDQGDKNIEAVAEYLNKVALIFVRESSGEAALRSIVSSDNIRRTCDMVLQNDCLELKNIFLSRTPRNISNEIRNAVAIVPNVKLFTRISRSETLGLYQGIIKKLLDMGKDIYVIAHSVESGFERELCEMFPYNIHVHNCGETFDCLEYEEVISNFQFVIASRYHSIIHAYKQGVPCLILGWADKYKELAELFHQERLLFDTRDEVNYEDIVEAIKSIDEHYVEESKEIMSIISKCTRENCFEEIWAAIQ